MPASPKFSDAKVASAKAREARCTWLTSTRASSGLNVVVGAHLPISLGAGLAAQYKKTDKVSVAFTGDGSTNIGAFHESMNLAAVWRLPVVVVVENNHYGEYSPLVATTSVTRLSGRAAAYGIPGLLVDGNDLLAVRQSCR